MTDMEKELSDAIALTAPVSKLFDMMFGEVPPVPSIRPNDIKPEYLPKRKYRVHREIQFWTGDIEWDVTYYPTDDDWSDAEVRLHGSDTNILDYLSCTFEADMTRAINKDFEDWRNGE